MINIYTILSIGQQQCNGVISTAAIEVVGIVECVFENELRIDRCDPARHGPREVDAFYVVLELEALVVAGAEQCEVDVVEVTGL